MKTNGRNARFEASLDYAKRGWSVFPLHSIQVNGLCTCGRRECPKPGKHPRTEHGFYDATRNLGKITAWWECSPNSNVGIRTGLDSNLVVIDVDGQKGEKSLDELTRRIGGLPETLRSRTGRGTHLYFRYPADETIKNSTGKLGNGLDVRADGGYVVAPPSIHEFRTIYEWDLKTERAVLPDTVTKLLAEPRPEARVPSGTAKEIPEGQRNDVLFRLGSMMRRGGFCEEAILGALLKENESNCNPPLAESEVRRIAQSAGRYPVVVKSGGPLDLARWGEPEPLGEDLLPVPPFEPNMLPQAFREHVSDVADRMQVPLDLPAVCCVGCLGGVVNRRATIQPKRIDEGWIVTPNLWGGMIAPPGQMKSNVLSTSTQHMSRIESLWRAEHETELENYDEWERERKLRERAWEQEFIRATKKGEIPPVRSDETRVRPTLRRLIANDPTFEAIHAILAENPAGVLLVRDELSGWLATLDKPGREGERQFFLESWNGDKPYTVDRIGRGTIYVQALCLSVLGGIQPGRLRQYLAEAVKDGPGNDGLFQRLQLIVWPDFPKNWKLVDRPPNHDAARRVARVYERLAELSPDVPLKLKFADDAQELFYEWWAELEGKIRASDLHPALTAHLSKYRSLMPSLALLFELADAEDMTATENVSLTHARQAAAWCEYLEAHARRIYGCLVSPEIHAARELGKKIQKGKLSQEFSTRDVYTRGWSGLGTPDEARAALRLLEECGWIRAVDFEERIGRPPERWQVNPKLSGGKA